MKRTTLIVMTEWSMTRTKYQRVYKDEKGELYIKVDGEYKQLKGMPCEQYITEGDL